MSNPALRVLAIDPGLASCGLALCSVSRIRQVQPIELKTVHTDDQESLEVRLHVLSDAIGEMVTKAQRGASWLDGVVLEDPTASVQRSAAGIRKDPRNIYKLCAAYGAIAAAAAHWVDQHRLTCVPVSRWYPRDGRHTMRHEYVLARIRERHPELQGKSEHVAFALGLADWWSTQVAPLVWDQQRRAVAFATSPSTSEVIRS